MLGHRLYGRWFEGKFRVSENKLLRESFVHESDFHRKSNILSDTNQYPDNKLLTEQQHASESGEKSDESSEKYVIDKPEGNEKNEYDEEDGKRDDSEKVIRADKKIVGEKLPPGWEKHEGEPGA